ncbi:MAG TPA: adenylate/guanylate cyclase domain-containing protein [Acidimicrobiales bacterium]|nr:adenylate/guanylate cyclase domain-containing protein [Acidimicrobiales bacterium]
MPSSRLATSPSAPAGEEGGSLLAGKPPAASEWLDAARQEERRGEFLAAFDLASRGLELHPHDLWLKHRAVLALARSGSTNEAARCFVSFGLEGVENEEIAALRARIDKDVAFSSTGSDRRLLADRAARSYASIYARTGGYYPAVNAATMALVSGDGARSRALASEVLSVLEREQDDTYYAAATAAEANLLLGHAERAREALELAVSIDPDDHAAHFSTRRQLRTICRLMGADDALLDVLAGPDVAHFCGHMVDGGTGEASMAALDEGLMTARMAAELKRRPVGVAYGALANGADILWAEALLSSGCELHIVLPVPEEEFVRASVAPAGEDWVRRFHKCLDAAAGVRFATEDSSPADDVLYRYGTELAMGLALSRAGYLDSHVRQLAIWDGQPAKGDSGTAAAIATWLRAGGAATILEPITGPTTQGSRARERDARRATEGSRLLRCLLFADVRGFSKLTDSELPGFATHVLGAVSRVVEHHAESIEYQNTWGDALYAVITDAKAAAACALELQEGIGRIDLQTAGLPSQLAMRLGAHYGPVLAVWDPVLNRRTFMGSHVSRTARLEPVTPPGAAYVTEHFAAALRLASADDFACDYVGHMPAAKDFGRLRMYRLRRSEGR